MNKVSKTNTFGVPSSAIRNPQLLKIQKGLNSNNALQRNSPHRSILSRILMVLASLILIGPGTFFTYVAYLAYTDSGMTAIVIPGVLALIFIGGSMAGLASSVRN